MQTDGRCAHRRNDDHKPAERDGMVEGFATWILQKYCKTFLDLTVQMKSLVTKRDKRQSENTELPQSRATCMSHFVKKAQVT